MKKTSHHHQDHQNNHQDHHQKTESAPTIAPVEKEEAVDPLSKLQAEVTTLRHQVEQYRDQALRAAADLENYRKRMLREKEEVLRYANSSLLEKFLPIVDNFELGLSAARTAAQKDPQTMEIINGFSMVERQFQDFLQNHGMEPINAIGQTFDPKLHEALSHQADEQLPEGQVIHQLRRGYLLAGRLLRPASVIVSKGKINE